MKKNIVEVTLRVKLPGHLSAQDAQDIVEELVGEGQHVAQNIAETTSDREMRDRCVRALSAYIVMYSPRLVCTEGTDLDCRVDIDEAEYRGNGDDGVYYQVFEDEDGQWYMSAIVDCNTGSFCDNLVTADGPYNNAMSAEYAGRTVALDWCDHNNVSDDTERNYDS